MPAYPSSPDATTSAILGASSVGWSPQRSPRRVMGDEDNAGAETPSDFGGGDSEHGSPSRMTVPAHRANLGALRSHGLVSNSIFKGNPSPTGSQVSPSLSPSRRRMMGTSDATASSPSDRSPVRPGLGLGISASPGKVTAGAFHVARSTSATSIDSFGSGSDAENEHQQSPYSNHNGSPRKSTNFRRLEQANYVSNSPFRRAHPVNHARPNSVSYSEADTQPLPLPDNAWAKSAASAAARTTSTVHSGPEITTPVKEYADDPFAINDVAVTTPTSNSTPRGAMRKAANASVDSPSSGRGLLVSNRLHGPRQMDLSGATSMPDSPHDSPTKRERRKTVTFDEILDVQEFDRERSYDQESLQSGSSEASSLHEGGYGRGVMREAGSDDDAMWMNDDGAQKVVERLMVVNGSPDTVSSAFTTPELESATATRDQYPGSEDMDGGALDGSSSDSREDTSLDEPHSPLADESSFNHNAEKTFVSAVDETAYHDVGQYTDADMSVGNLSPFGALHRVESMVDELLGDELLDGRVREQQRMREASPELSVMDSPPRRRGKATTSTRAAVNNVAVTRPLSVKSAAVSAREGMSQATDLTLNLPAWSPFMPNAISPRTAEPAMTAVGQQSPSAQARPKGRPHISREAVLQRVAQEKKMMLKEGQTGQTSRSGEDNAVAALHTTNMPVAVPAVPVRRASIPSSDEQRSPLERLGEQVVVEQKQKDATPSEATTDSTVRRQLGWFGGSSREGSLEPEVRPLASAGVVVAAATQPAVAGLVSAQPAKQTIAPRQSKDDKNERGSKRQSVEVPRQSADAVDEVASTSSLPKEALSASSSGSSDLQLSLPENTLKAVADNDGFESGMQRELSRIYRQGDSKYHVKDRGVYTHEGKTSPSRAGTADGATSTREEAGTQGRAWRKLRRPSDMNEYAKEMREYRAKENPKKVAGKVFVMVDAFTPSNLPVPTTRSTRFYCVLDNGLHVVRTGSASLRHSGPSKIGQEFELVQHRNLSFSLTLVAQRDPHLQEPKAEVDGAGSSAASMNGSPSKSRDRITPSFSRSVGKLFSSPKKRAAGGGASVFGGSSSSLAEQNGVVAQTEPMLAYMNRDGAFGQCQVLFEQIANDCLVQCYTVDVPVHGVRDPPSSTATANGGPSTGMPRSAQSSADFSRNLGKVRGTLRLKIFYLPPLPGVAKTLLPQNLSECIKGMEAGRWHAGQQQKPWMQGTLTQLGGDCQSWRRRPLKAQGVHLIGYNEITKKPVIKIDLSKALSVEETHDPVKAGDARRDNVDSDEEIDETYHVERSFRISFKDGEKIFFFADSDAEVQQWIKALSKVVGNTQLPPQCAWAQAALEMVKIASTASASPTAPTASTSTASNATAPSPTKSSSASPLRSTAEARAAMRNSMLAMPPPTAGSSMGSRRVAVPTLVEEEA